MANRVTGETGMKNGQLILHCFPVPLCPIFARSLFPIPPFPCFPIYLCPIEVIPKLVLPVLPDRASRAPMPN